MADFKTPFEKAIAPKPSGNMVPTQGDNPCKPVEGAPIVKGKVTPKPLISNTLYHGK